MSLLIPARCVWEAMKFPGSFDSLMQWWWFNRPLLQAIEAELPEVGAQLEAQFFDRARRLLDAEGCMVLLPTAPAPRRAAEPVAEPEPVPEPEEV